MLAKFKRLRYLSKPSQQLFLKLNFNPEFDYLVQLVFVQRFLLLGR